MLIRTNKIKLYNNNNNKQIQFVKILMMCQIQFKKWRFWK